MNEKTRYGIKWHRSVLQFAQIVWGLATYIGFLCGAAVFAWRSASGSPVVAAVCGVGLGTVFNWIVFGMIEHGELKRLNK
jgi:hypothetical protein